MGQAPWHTPCQPSKAAVVVATSNATHHGDRVDDEQRGAPGVEVVHLAAPPHHEALVAVPEVHFGDPKQQQAV